MKKYILWWYKADGGIAFALDINKKAQLFTIEDATAHKQQNQNITITEVGYEAAGWVEQQ